MGWLDKLLGRGEALRLRQGRACGQLYPADPDALAARVDAALAAVSAHPATAPHAVIAPYGGDAPAWASAAAAWAALAEDRGQVERAIVVASSHFVPFSGIATTGFDGWRTPLGVVRRHAAATDALVAAGALRVVEPAFDPDYALEAQLPWLQRALGEVSVVGLLVGDAQPEAVVEVLDALWAPHTAVVASANLSGDVPATTAKARDAETAEAIAAGRPEAIERRHSQSRILLQAMVRWAAARGLAGRELARATSPADRPDDPVIGYGAFGFGEF